ncbi:MAG TPA: sialate O-acetylesterase [Opitutales bacterium]|jgi:sialate O-acetylesterase|nr:sialate O-acetylesterase [Opitutales bacterium]
MKTYPLKNLFCSSLAVITAFLSTAPLHADVKLATPFTNHMVLQREMKVPVWGTADTGEQVTVEFAGQKKTVLATDGKWRVDLDAMDASADGRTLTVSGSKTDQPVKLDDVLVGEVWLASGQSNMVFPVTSSGPYRGLINYQGEIAAATYPQIRMFTGTDTKSYTPQDTVKNTGWVVCSPDTVGTFSAVGYVFARDLQLQIKVPVGILCEASGASCAEAWISREGMLADSLTSPILNAFDTGYKLYNSGPQGQAAEALIRPTPINKPRVARPGPPDRDQHMPTVLFNAMINPIVPYAIRGTIWYQGESIVGGTPGLNMYGHVLQILIKDWRAKWGEGDMPFYVVQLPGQQNISNNPRIREEQMSVLTLPNTGVAVTIDTGEATNVHPQNKAPTGYRLACIALANAYHQKIEFEGPLYQSLEIKGDKAVVHFTHIGGGLVAKDSPLKGFQVAGADKKFFDALAEVDGDTLVVSSAQVSAPVAVRYAWDDFPEGLGCNFYNKYDFPAFPFRTDNWDYPIPGIVEQ